MKSFTQFALTTFILIGAVLVGLRQDLAQTPGRGKIPANRVSITTQGDVREIRSNGIPDHKPGQFPNRHNPHAILEQKYEFRVALDPSPSRTPAPLGMNPFGVAVNGVPFDPGAAEFWNRDPGSGWQYEALSGKIHLGLDSSNAHVQPNGAYHYHGIPTALCERLSGGKSQMTFVGYAADGYPIYALYGFADPKSAESEVKKMQSSYRLKKGNRTGGPRGKYDGSFIQDYEYVAGSGDLDECNGREGVTPEYPDGTYYYVLTEGYPFIPRQLHGTPDASFRHGPPGGRRGGPPPRGRRPG
jgi:YHYH protein